MRGNCSVGERGKQLAQVRGRGAEVLRSAAICLFLCLKEEEEKNIASA
jgi:hypothetical protein